VPCGTILSLESFGLGVVDVVNFMSSILRPPY
jgi:hypothetical protein